MSLNFYEENQPFFKHKYMLCLCVCVCVYACVYVCMHVCICVCVYNLPPPSSTESRGHLYVKCCVCLQVFNPHSLRMMT
jgi:hypothetical protein